MIFSIKYTNHSNPPHSEYLSGNRLYRQEDTACVLNVQSEFHEEPIEELVSYTQYRTRQYLEEKYSVCLEIGSIPTNRFVRIELLWTTKEPRRLRS